MELKPRDRIVQLKIVYYGPAVCGKTTNLQMLHAAAQGRHRGEFITVNSQQERTILFDLLPLRGVGFHGFDIRFQIVAVPGQAPYAATRRLVTRGTDAVVFVANSAADRLQENVASLQEMNGNLSANGLDPATIPLVFQYNKRDLPEVSSVEELTAALNRRRAPWLEAVAIRGDGVLETLGTVLEHTMEDLTAKYRSLALEPGETVQTWAWGAIQQVFGRTTLAGSVGRPGEDGEGDRRRVQVAVARLPRGASEATADKGLIDSYVQASMELSQALDRMREERDEALRRVAEMELDPARDRGARGRRASRGDAAGDAHPPRRGRLLRAEQPDRPGGGSPPAHHRLGGDGERPVPREPRGVPDREAALRPAEEPRCWWTWRSRPRWPRCVAPLDPPVKALAVVPVRSGFGLHGLAMFYFTARDPLPSPTTLAHIGLMARALAAWFVVRRGRSLETSAEAARRALPEIERVAKLAGDLVRAAARQPEMAKAHLERAARTLDGVATLARGLQVPAASGKKG